MTFALPGNRSLKGKRHVVRRICDRLRHKFHATAAETGDTEQWSEAEIAFAMVSGNRAQAQGMAENILGYIEDLMIAPLSEVELEVIAFDDFLGRGEYSWSERGADGLLPKIEHDVDGATGWREEE